MAHAQCEMLLYVHGAILGFAGSAFYKYSDRTEAFGSSFSGTESAARELRRKLASELEEELRPVFESPGSVPSPILGATGRPVNEGTYVESAVNPLGSEKYIEAVRAFVDENSRAIADYRSLTLGLARWCAWSSDLSQTLLILIGWTCAVLLMLAVDKFDFLAVPVWLLIVTNILTAILAIKVFVCGFARLHSYRQIMDVRQRHGEI